MENGYGGLCIAAFLIIMAAVGFIAGLVLGNENAAIARPFHDIESLALYVDVEPGASGQQLMDAGRIFFKPGSHLEMGKSMSFKNGNVYCVAPVTSSARSSALGDAVSYDFWAVGVNCCSGARSDFHCGEHSNPLAAAGLRLMDDSQRPFFRLAVQQAEAAYNIHAPHPIFVNWMQDPNTKAHSYLDEAHKQFTISVWCFLVLQAFAVAGLAVTLTGWSHG